MSGTRLQTRGDGILAAPSEKHGPKASGGTEEGRSECIRWQGEFAGRGVT